jgi:deazaflavin-dependent oxidoreductase (nitroreductase family)
MNRLLIASTKVGSPIFGDEGPLILTVTGRNTGRPRSTPITPMRVDGKRYVVDRFPGADWVRNARVDPDVTLTQNRRSEQVHMVEMPPDEFEALTGCCAVFRFDAIT